MKKRKVYKLPCSWEMYAWIEVEAESLSEAIEKAYDEVDLPHNGEYVDSSFDVDMAIVKEDYPNEDTGDW